MSTSNLPVNPTCTDHLYGTGVVAKLEGVICWLLGFRHVVSMSSASTALEAAYDALGLGPGNTVIAPSFTAPETISALLRRGCTLVFADIQPDTLTLCPEAVEQCITPATKAIVAVDLFGWPHDTAAIRAIADRYGLSYVADCAQGFGASIDGRSSGWAADAVILSLNAQKELAAGEGGILATNDQALAEHVIRETQHPHRQARELGQARVNHFARNDRINPLAAAVAVKHLPAVLKRIEQRQRAARVLIELLNATGLTERISIPEFCGPSFPHITAAWSGTQEPVELLTLLHKAGFACRLRDLPVRPVHDLAQRRFPDQVRIPYPLVHTEGMARRAFRLEVSWS